MTLPLKQKNLQNALMIFLGGLSLSAFIYLAHFGVEMKIIHTLLAVVGFYLWLHSDKKRLFFIGSLVGALWFYWIALSFRYYDMPYLIPLGIIAVSVIYGIIFYVSGLFSPFWRFLPIIALEHIYPFDFNYFNPKLVVLHSYISTDTTLFVLFLLGLYFAKVMYQKSLIPFLAYGLSFAFLLGLIHYNEIQQPTSKNTLPQLPNIDIALVHTDIDQRNKWDKESIRQEVNAHFEEIQKAIAEHKAVIIFPESAFAFPLNQEPLLLEKLSRYSHDITIVAGSLFITTDQKYNTTYIFQKGEWEMHHKHILTPFGEAVPLPDFLRDGINDLFYGGSSDFDKAVSYSDTMIEGEVFRTAICFEATREELFAHSPKYMIAISNNAWFYPSIQPTLQHLLLEYLSKKYGTVIYHATNRGKNAIIW